MIKTWNEVKQSGSVHYKSGGSEVIDLLKDVQYFRGLTVAEIKAFADSIKYCYRMLTQGTNEKDLGKVQHLMDIAGAAWQERERLKISNITSNFQG